MDTRSILPFLPHAEVRGEAVPRSICFRIRQPFEALLRRVPQGEDGLALICFVPGRKMVRKPMAGSTEQSWKTKVMLVWSAR